MIAELPRLSGEERELVAKALRNLDGAREAVEATPPTSKRRAGMHPGAMVMSDDFDEPLPNSFWLGEDA